MSIPSCRICGAPSEYFCLWCESSCFCTKHVCAHIGKDLARKEQASKPVPALGPELKAVLIFLGVLVLLCILFALGGTGDGMPQP